MRNCGTVCALICINASRLAGHRAKEDGIAMKPMIYYVAGKSGGHIIPALTHARQFVASHPGYEIGMFSTDASFDLQCISPVAMIKRHIPLAIGSISRTRMWHYPAFCARVLWAFVQSFKELRTTRPEKIISMGGYVSIPV